MTTFDEPTRLSELGSEAPDSLRQLLSAARGDLPTAAELARVQARLDPLFHTPPPAPAPAPSAAALAPTAKLGLLALGGVAVAGAIWLGTRSEPARPTAKPAAPSAEQTIDPPERAAPPAPKPSPEPAPAQSEPAVPADEGPSSVNTPPPAPHRTAAPRPEPRPEDALLEDARKALSSNPQRALLLTREHEVTYPGGVLTQEREVIAIEALRRLGRSEEAAKRLERFEQRYPQSAHRRKLEGPATAP